MSCQRILDVRWDLRENLAANDIIPFKFAEMFCQHLFRGVGNEPLEFAEPARSILEVKEDERLPLSTDDLRGKLDGAISAIHRALKDTK